jgi:hypothetical protein
MLTEKQQEFRENALICGTSLLFVAGLTMAIVGGLTGATATFGIGLGVCIVLTVIGICVRERNIAS